MALVLAGLIGLGAEAGAWYTMKRHQQNAADAAAIAGALTLMTPGGVGDCHYYQAAAAASGQFVAAQNGYSNGVSGVTVSVQAPPPEGNAFHGDACAAYATISNTIPAVFAGPFIGRTTTVSNIAVAKIKQATVNCALALNQLSFNGTISLTGDCSAEANSSASNAITISGNSGTFSNGVLVTPGGCSGQCPDSSVLSTHAIPGSDPFTAIYDPVTRTAGVSFSGLSRTGSCVANSPSENNWSPSTLTPSWTSSGIIKAYCGNSNNSHITLKVAPGASLDLSPGTYVFWNIGVDMQGTVTCSTCSGQNGVTIIVTGSSGNIGTLTITAGASVILSAPTSNSVNSAFDGVLFYMDYRATDPSNGNAAVDITAGSASILTGGMYFPSVRFAFGGNADTQSRCTNIVAANITLSGTTALNVSGCDPTKLSRISKLAMLQ